MADSTEGTAGTVISDVSPALAAIPYVGPILSLAGSIGGGLLQQDAAKKQAAQATNEATQAKYLKPEAIQPEYLKMLRIHQAMALAGYPGYEQDKSALEDAYAANVRAIKESSPNGTATLNALSRQMYANNQSLTALAGQNAKYQAGVQDQVATDEGTIGGAKRSLEIARDAERTRMLNQVQQLQNAAMNNKFNAYGSITNAIGNTANNLLGKAELEATNGYTNPVNGSLGYDSQGYPIIRKPASVTPGNGNSGADNTYYGQTNGIQGMQGASNPLGAATTTAPIAQPENDSSNMWNFATFDRI